MYLLDTNILSLNFRGDERVAKFFTEEILANICLCSISLAECYFGAENCPNKDYKIQLLSYYDAISSSLKVFDFDLNSAKILAKLKNNLKISGKIIQDFDLMIASICLANSCTLVTHNTKDFKNIPGLKLEDWTT